MNEEIKRKLVIVRGVVQGVGFRPFIYNLAQQYGLRGGVNNSSQGVEIDVEGPLRELTYFINKIKEEPPPLAQIEEVVITAKVRRGYEGFAIEESREESGNLTFAAPDTALCEDCKEELKNPQDRRYRYPFINCTNCGPRFSIIKNLPYDRSETTMAEFDMCEKCRAEYQSPASRRFHAQPNACPDCGPKLRLLDKEGEELKDPLAETVRLLAASKIIAVKGLGGFHLLCDGRNEQAVERLRVKKKRPAKALAVMMKNLETVKKYCYLSSKEEEIIQGAKRPILLLRKRKETIAAGLAPDTNYLGVMLPYTPLHLLLLEEFEFLVATSANLSGQPLEYTDQGAKENLSNLADYSLIHNRKIEVPIDDAVSQVINRCEQVIRQGRGYAPSVIKIKEGVATLACGGDLKNTFCLSRGEDAFLSQYTGDLSNLANYQRYQENINHLQQLYGVEPQLIAHDLHPGYYTTQYAQDLAGEKVAIQHHHAHLAAVMSEHKLMGPVIGLAFDGLGLGSDGQIWGGEFFICDYSDFLRVGHLKYLTQPGGDQAVKEPWRMAVSYLTAAGLKVETSLFSGVEEDKLLGVKKMAADKINSPLTSSMGRLFAAVAALLGLCRIRDYQGQAAIKLEAAAQRVKTDKYYNYRIIKEEGQYQIITTPLIREIYSDLAAGLDKEVLARKFHNTVIEFSLKLCEILRLQFKLKKVVLSGGVWQNGILQTAIYQRLTTAGFEVYLPGQISCTDQGLSVGQLIVANYRKRGRL